jgi:NADPH-dependent 2,4-dienoyl-CoA reductase/sulfur reductase-like enzyme
LLPGARLVVIGAGFIGAEVASTASTLGLDVTVLEAAPTPLAGPLGAQLGQVLAGLHRRAGVTLRTGVAPVGFEGTQRVSAVRLADGTSLAADVVVVGVGAAPNVEWLEDSPLTLANGVACDEHGATNVLGVFAVGDCAAWHDPSSGGPRRVEHWTGALERPTIVAQRLLHGRAHSAPRPVYFWSDQYGARIQFAGSIAGHDAVTVEDGDLKELRFLATYRRGGEVIGVLGVDSVRQFTRWRRQLTPLAQPA